MKAALALAEKGLIPRPLIRRGIRNLIQQRLSDQDKRFGKGPDAVMQSWVEHMRNAPIALQPESANAQHYEVPPQFFEWVLGKHRKYSSAYYSNPETPLDKAEEAMLGLTCQRANLQDGQDVLELGCGWGSLTLYMAQRFPNSRILAVSNSVPQRRYIRERAADLGLHNVVVITRDMNKFDTELTFDRVVSVEMFEHMRNWEALLGRISHWIRPQGYMFMHVFAHRRFAYPFEVRNANDWMSQHFFTGGMMPSHDLLDHLEIPFTVEQRWEVSGTHYANTAEDWARNADKHSREIIELFDEVYGSGQGRRWLNRWRIFFLSCAELFAWDAGNEWIVSHQLLRPKANPGKKNQQQVVKP